MGYVLGGGFMNGDTGYNNLSCDVKKVFLFLVSKSFLK